MDLNKAMIIGNLTADPVIKTTGTGVSVCNFSVATNFVYQNQQTGQKETTPEFHNIVMWRKLAEIASQYLKKGRRVYIEGRLQTRSWEDTAGVKKYRTELIADNMIMLDGGTGGSGTQKPNEVDLASPQTAYQNNAVTSQTASQPSSLPVLEELPTINQDEVDIKVEDIPF